MTGRSHYEVLGVEHGASARDIRHAYRALALRYHPDVYSGPDAGSRFREIADAYEVLNDPVQRASYDALAPAAQGRNDRSAVWGVGRRARDVPRFVDDRQEVRLVVGDEIRALLQELLADGPAVRMGGWARSGGPSLSRQSWRTEVWRWR
jgi:curved DNA-binding protein CbpA